MPTNTINISRSVRMRYFNGLFLQDQEFRTDQNFYIAIRRYLNFLLFDPGRLYVDDTIAPLQVSAAGMQVSVTPGSALIRDTATMSGYELEIPDLPVTDREFDLSTESLSNGDTLTVTLQRDESDFISMGGGGAGVSPSEDDRTVERALLSVNLPADPAPTPPFVTLATITAVVSGGGGGAADTLNVTNTTERGGVRLAILSEQVRAMLGVSTAPVITSFAPTSGLIEDPVIITGTNFNGATAVAFGGTSATFTVNSAGTQIDTTVPSGATTGRITVTTPIDTATSSMDFTVGTVGPSITGFSPSSGAIGEPVIITGTNFNGATEMSFGGTSAVFSVNPAGTQIDTTVPTGASTGPITVTVGLITATSATNFTVVTVNPEIVNTDVTRQASGAPVEVRGNNIRIAIPPASSGDNAVGTSIRLNAPAGAIPPSVVATTVTVRPNVGSLNLQAIRFLMPTRPGTWASNQTVTLVLGFEGGDDAIPFFYDD